MFVLYVDFSCEVLVLKHLFCLFLHFFVHLSHVSSLLRLLRKFFGELGFQERRNVCVVKVYTAKSSKPFSDNAMDGMVASLGEGAVKRRE